jgi:hypothetical protein
MCAGLPVTWVLTIPLRQGLYTMLPFTALPPSVTVPQMGADASCPRTWLGDDCGIRYAVADFPA